MSSHASPDEPSAWVVRWAPEVKAGPVLDVACGGGRHARFFRDMGFEVVAVDRQPVVLEEIKVVTADLENGPWPFEGEQFGAIVITNYLHRPLFPHLLRSLAPGGLLIYETFMAGNERFGRPSNPDFLLRPGELRAAFSSLTILGFEQGPVERPRPAVTQRICARKPANL